MESAAAFFDERRVVAARQKHSRSRTVGHGESYRGKQVGVRCCKDPG
jgi:hypothetical protein